MTDKDYDQLSLVNKELLKLDRAVKDTLFRGIQERLTLFAQTGLLVKMQDIQVSLCQSQVKLLHRIRRDIHHSMTNHTGHPNTEQRIGVIIIGEIVETFKQTIFSNNKQHSMNSAQFPHEAPKGLPIPKPHLHCSKEQQLTQQLQDMTESTNVFIKENIYEDRIIYAKLGLGKEAYKIIDLCEQLSTALQELKQKTTVAIQ